MISKKKLILKYFFIYIISLILISFIVFILSFFIKLEIFPEKYDYLTFWVTIFNTLFWSWIIFSIYQWFIDRENQIKDNFISRFDFLLDNFSPDLDSDLLTMKWYNPFLLENFETITLEEKHNQLYLEVKFKENIVFDYYKDNSDIYEYLYKNYQIINFLDIKKEVYQFDEEISSYIRSRLMLYKNLKFYSYLFLLLRIRSKNLLTNNSSSLEWKWKYLIVDNKKIFQYISEMNKKILRISDIFKI